AGCELEAGRVAVDLDQQARTGPAGDVLAARCLRGAHHRPLAERADRRRQVVVDAVASDAKLVAKGLDGPVERPGGEGDVDHPEIEVRAALRDIADLPEIPGVGHTEPRVPFAHELD